MTRIEQVNQFAYLVRCEGLREGRRCKALLEVTSGDKSVCALCGWVSPPWGAYLAERTVLK